MFQTVFHKGILNEWLGDHVVHGEIICPGVGLLELACAAASKALNPSAWRKQSAGGASSGPSSMCVEGFTINRPVVVNDIRQSSGDSVAQPTSINCIVEDDGQVEICMDSLEEGRVKFAEGTVSFQQEGIDWKAIAEGVLAGRDACDQVVIGADVYRDFDSSGLRYGPTFRLLESIRYSQSTCYATLSASTIRGAELYTFSPPLMDAVLQASAVLVANYRKASSVQVDQNSAAQVPFSFNKVSVHISVLESMDVSAQCGCFVSIQKMEPSMTVFDCSLLTATGDVAVHIEGVHVRPIAPLSDKSGVASTHAVKELSCSWVEHAQSVGGAASLNLLEGGHKRLLLVGDASACSVVQDKLLAAAPEQQSMVIETCSVEELGRIEEAGSSADYDIVVLLLLLNLDVGDSDVCGGNLVESMLRVMQTLCKRTRHLLTVLPHSSAESLSSHGGLSSCIGGVMLSAQVEFATVQMEVLACEVSADPSESMDVMSSAAAEELTSWTSELEVLLKQGKRFVKRYAEASLGGEMTELHLHERGSFEGLELRQAPVPSGDLPADFVEISIAAVSLNFRDVLNVLGMYPGDPGDPGCEYAGVVTAVGSAVTRFKAGDEVTGVGTGCLKEFYRDHELMMEHRPQCLSMEEAATIPIVYCTVEWALTEIAQLKAGETVLIHAAAGGVGLAAIQYAQRVGARVVATASEGKRDYLRSLGVELITSSRDAAVFAEELKSVLGCHGKVDVVLNSLNNDFIPHSLDALAPNGRFVEIGKRGIWSDEEVAARRGDVKYQVIALDHLIAEDLLKFNSLLRTVCDGFNVGEWRAQRVSTFNARTEFTDAFKLLRTGKNIGKVVLAFEHFRRYTAVRPVTPDFRSVGAYIITGGLGGLGLQTAKLLVRLGAKHLFLVSRSGKVPYEGQGLEEDLAWLQSAESGADVHIMRCDVSDESSVVSMLSAARSAAAGGIAGVVHCAGVLRDALIRGGGAASGCGEVWRAKALSAWWLHKHTLEGSISTFVTFSSQTAALGNIGQTTYGAANRFLDSLAECRQRSGLAAVSIRWPAVAGKGMAASSLGDRLSEEDAGDWSISADEASWVLERVLQARAWRAPSGEHSAREDHRVVQRCGAEAVREGVLHGCLFCRCRCCCCRGGGGG